MHQIQIETLDFSVLSELESLLGSNEYIDIIQGRNFSGDLTNIELYFRLATDVIAVLTPIITLLIQKKRISSIKIDGKKIELENVSHDLAEEALRKRARAEKQKMRAEKKQGVVKEKEEQKENKEADAEEAKEKVQKAEPAETDKKTPQKETAEGS